MKKTIKILLIISIFLMLISVLQNFSFATDWNSRVSGMISNSKEHDTSGASKSVNNIAGAAIVIIRVIGVGVAIIMIMVVAMKYMLAAPGDRADIKKHAVVYLIGAVVLFATSGILGIIANFAGGIGK